MPKFETIDIAHNKIHRGNHFSYDDVVTLASAAVQNYLITTPDTDKVGHLGYQIEGNLGFTFEFFEATDKTGTTGQTNIYNQNRNSSTVNGIGLHKGISAEALEVDGTKIGYKQSGSATVGGKLQGTDGSSLERILKRNTKYIMRITSLANANVVSVQLNWYESQVKE